MKKLLPYIMSLALITGCSKKEEDAATTSTDVTAEVVSNLTAISSDFAPASIEYSSAVNSQVHQMSGGPCGSSDFFECQSILLKLYVYLGQQMVDMATMVVSQVGSHLGQIEDGGTGSVSEEGQTVAYSKTDSSNFSILMTDANSNPGLYVNVADNVYSVKVDTGVLDSGTPGTKLDLVVTFTDENTWDVTFFMHNPDCSADDVSAPEKIKITLSKANGLWTGKTMMYHPRWQGVAQSATCDTTPDANTKVAFYTDFIGNDTATKAAIYLSKPASISNVSELEDYGMDSFCTNFSGICDGSNGWGAVTTNYPNPFCSTGPTTPVFGTSNGGDCSSADSTVSAASFGASSLWVLPSTYADQTITIPSEL